MQGDREMDWGFARRLDEAATCRKAAGTPPIGDRPPDDRRFPEDHAPQEIADVSNV
jgi:hypothetical protein